jgi:hypothetical protein
MKLYNKINVLVISSSILLGLISTPLTAGSLTLGYSSGGHHNKHYNSGHHNSYRHHNYSYGHRNSYRYKHYAYPSYPISSYRNNNNYSNHSSYTKPCHQVSKTVVDGYGQYQKIGGTMCYNSYGQGYVVSGSRYQIQ